MMKIDEKILKLLEYDLKPTPRGGWKITEEMRALIHEISEECKGMEIVQRVTKDKEEWLGSCHSGGSLHPYAEKK